MTDEHKDGPRPSLRFGGLAQQQQVVKSPDRLGRKAEQSMIAPPAAPERPGTQTLKRSSADRERQTVYLPPELMRRVRHRIADTREEISEVVEKALLVFLDQEGN